MSNDARQRAKENNMAAPLPETGFIRLAAIVGKPATDTAPAIPAIFPVCRSTWWAGVKSGRYPKPCQLGERITAWRVEDIRALIEQGRKV